VPVHGSIGENDEKGTETPQERDKFQKLIKIPSLLYINILYLPGSAKMCFPRFPVQGIYSRTLQDFY